MMAHQRRGAEPPLGVLSPLPFYPNPALRTRFSNQCLGITVFQCFFLCDSEAWGEYGAPCREGSGSPRCIRC